mgnify:CR=1 FL=1
MSESEDKNRNIRIKQQKQNLVRRIMICVVLLVLLTVVFIVINKNARGTEISYNTFTEQLAAGNIKEINVNQSRIQLYYQNGEAHWLNNRQNIWENDILQKWEEMPVESRPILKLGTTSTISILNILYPILMIGIAIVMIVFIVKQLSGAKNSNLDFVKSRARIYPSKTKFSDVAGADEEKEELEDVVDFLKNPKKYTALGAKIPKGVILVGPPGTGKTLLARAVAGEANVPFFTISGSDFMELFVGVGASRVRDLFENAKKAKPCIIFIDEIDAVGRQRGAGLGGGNDEREQTLNQLLVQMDGFEENEGIIVMAATNRVDILDPALLRPGRFDRRININIPDIKGREEILKVHARGKSFASDVNFKTIARITAGFTGAELENLLNEAAIMVAKENRHEINGEDLQKAIMKVSLGPQKRSRVIDEKDKYDTAVHESGHALISKLAKEKTPVHEVSIIPRGGAGGYTVSTDDDSTVYFKEKLLCKIQMLLGGATAEKLYVGDYSTGASNDLKRATSIARRMVTEWGMSENLGLVYCGSDDEVFIGKSYQERMPYSENQGKIIDEEIKKIIDYCQKETTRILTEYKDALMTMVNVLMERETIYTEEVEMIINGKSKEEVIEYIDQKDKSHKAVSSKENSSKENSNSDSSSSFIDALLKTAETREKENEIVSDPAKTAKSEEETEKSSENVDSNENSSLTQKDEEKNETSEESQKETNLNDDETLSAVLDKIKEIVSTSEDLNEEAPKQDEENKAKDAEIKTEKEDLKSEDNSNEKPAKTAKSEDKSENSDKETKSDDKNDKTEK